MASGKPRLRLLGGALGSALAVMTVASMTALAGEGTGNYLGILSSAAPSVYTPSPGWYSLAQGQNLLTFQFNVTNLTADQQSMNLQLNLDHITKYLVNGQEMDVSDGQPGVVNGAIVDGQFDPLLSTAVQDPNPTFTAFAIGPNATQTVHISRTLPAGQCGYFQADVAKAGLTSQKGLVGFEIRVLGCGTPTIATSPLPTQGPIGVVIHDMASVIGGLTPTGSATFALYGPGNATGTGTNLVAGLSGFVDVALSGGKATSAGYTTTHAGTYNWVASYSGDANNDPAAGIAGDEQVVISEGIGLAQPSIRTTPNPASATAGATLKDSATLSGGQSPTGSIIFKLNDPNGAVAYTETVNVTVGNGTYSTPTGHVAVLAGMWHWKAAYSGDANNKPVAGNAADESVTVIATGGVLAATGAVLADTGSTPAADVLALILIGLGALAVMTALAWRRRASR